ncbi:hypothetical protein A6302_00284 [Methylobrevis pamukkalensis]|uniref:Uncharacterized protein n=1 Tax=Methylobrevis pamukkalensis TaxID=1439726 RepID=A0A1E3H7P9_9HYPH|nr:hypothetical protein A6302_00284 [Methylobrevis pamukkalensis]
MLGHPPRRLGEGPWRLVEDHPLAAIALHEAFHGEEQVGPDRLRTEVAAPDAAGERVHQEQRQRGEDQQAGEIVDLLRPDLDEEEIGAPPGQVDQHRLVGRVRPAIPADEGQEVVDAERDREDRPLDLPQPAVDRHRIDLLGTGVEDILLRRRWMHVHGSTLLGSQHVCRAGQARPFPGRLAPCPQLRRSALRQIKARTAGPSRRREKTCLARWPGRAQAAATKQGDGRS